MIIPAAMFIEMAVDQLKDPAYVGKNAAWLADQLRELDCAYPMACDKADTFGAGYQLGLATARVILAGSVALARAGVKAEDVL